jgi:flagellar basal body-associated protein FliL
MAKKNLFVTILISLLVLLVGGYSFNTYFLNKSKEEGKNIVSRAVKTESQVSSSSQLLSLETAKKNIKTGQFITLDPLHYAKENVELVEKNDKIRVNFSTDFATKPDGPDLYVWLVKKQEIKNIALGGLRSNPTDYLDLGAIQSKSGAQSYEINKSELGNFDYAVVIWCRAFGVQFSNAILN